MGQLNRFERWWLSALPHRLYIRRSVPQFLRMCPEPFRGEVLEVGAGRGWSSQCILDTFPQVALTAVDVDPAASIFTHLQQRYGRRLQFVMADLLSLPFDRDSFDVVVSIGALSYVDDVPQAIRQFLRVVRPGGLIGLSDENQAFVFGPVRWFFSPSSAFSRRSLEEIVRREGCELLVSQGFFRYYLWARKPYET